MLSLSIILGQEKKPEAWLQGGGNTTRRTPGQESKARASNTMVGDPWEKGCWLPSWSTDDRDTVLDFSFRL